MSLAGPTGQRIRLEPTSPSHPWPKVTRPGNCQVEDVWVNVPAKPTGKAAAQPTIRQRANMGNNADPPRGGQANSSGPPTGRPERESGRPGRPDPQALASPPKTDQPDHYSNPHPPTGGYAEQSRPADGRIGTTGPIRREADRPTAPARRVAGRNGNQSATGGLTPRVFARRSGRTQHQQ